MKMYFFTFITCLITTFVYSKAVNPGHNFGDTQNIPDSSFYDPALQERNIPFDSIGKITRYGVNFNKNWKFNLGDATDAQNPSFDDSNWRQLNLPHDWSIEGEFSEKNPATPGGGALPGGIGWYRKSFTIPETVKDRIFFINFDGIYRNSEVWINGHYLGIRPYGYSSFRYELTPFLKFGKENNVIAVKVDNSKQPNSRWYSGSGIYRNVSMVMFHKIAIDHWGVYVKASEINDKSAKVTVTTRIRNYTHTDQPVILATFIEDAKWQPVNQEHKTAAKGVILKDSVLEIIQEFIVDKPILWSLDNPYQYHVYSEARADNPGTTIYDSQFTPFGIRDFTFDANKGFILNGKQVKIKGVCNHHDLGCLGAAINIRALERQLEILKEMGCNGIRTSHNPPAPELLSLCDEMGFVVMDEAFDMWKKKKSDFDYHLDWDQWHKRDLEDMILRDRNHPSIFMWSIGNEILEQWDSTGIPISKELATIVKRLDNTRPVVSACNDPNPTNYIIKSGALDLIGYNYHHQMFPDFPATYPGQKFIAAETTSALATRGHYDMPSDTIRIWPIKWDIPFTTGNPDFSCSAYDNCHVPWGSTHEESWKLIKKYDFLSGMYIWTGFDYLGEPTPYSWPARSSYFGIIDLAGFPKDAYYMYQSEWTNKPVLHIFPHWNWKDGDTVDIWAYSNAEEVELFLNSKSLGAKKKEGDNLHITWKVPYKQGTLTAVSKSNGKKVLTKEIKTAGTPAKISLSADRNSIKADGNDLSFVTVKILDAKGNVVPDANNMVKFDISGNASIAGVDNGNPISHEPFKVNYRKAFNGLCVAVIQSKEAKGKIILTAKSEGLQAATIEIVAK